MITDAEISLLHSCYCKFTGASLPLRSICDARRLAWQRFAAAGHTQSELETVLFYLNRKVREDHWDRGCLRFTNLIEDLNHFEEVLAEARAYSRNLKSPITPKQEAISLLRPVASNHSYEQSTARNVSEISRKALADFQAWKKQMFGP